MNSPLHYSASDLARWGLLGAARREAVIDQLMGSVPLPPEAVADVLLRQWAQEQGISSASELEQRVAQLGLVGDGLQALVTRPWRWLQWCEQHCGARLNSHFLARKTALDRVSFWRLLTADADLAAELFQRLKEEESSFELLAQQASENEQLWDVSFTALQLLERLPSDLAALLRVSEPGVVWAPRPAAEGGWQLVQLQQRQPAVLDAAMRQMLLLELGEVVIAELLNASKT